MVEVRGEYVHKASASLGVWQIMVLSDFSSKPGFLSTSALVYKCLCTVQQIVPRNSNFVWEKGKA